MSGQSKKTYSEKGAGRTEGSKRGRKKGKNVIFLTEEEEKEIQCCSQKDMSPDQDGI